MADKKTCLFVFRDGRKSMGPFETMVETRALPLLQGRGREVANWVATAFNSRGGLGPWAVKDIRDGNTRFGVDGVRPRMDDFDISTALEQLEKGGVIRIQRIPAGLIEKFWINP